MTYRPLTPYLRDLVVSQYADGVPVSTIAERFDVAKSTPGQLARKAGVPLRTSKINRSLMARAAKWRRQRDGGAA